MTSHIEHQMTFGVFRCDRIKRGMPPQNEVLIASGFASAREAMNHANEAARRDRKHSYVVGCDEP